MKGPLSKRPWKFVFLRMFVFRTIFLFGDTIFSMTFLSNVTKEITICHFNYNKACWNDFPGKGSELEQLHDPFSNLSNHSFQGFLVWSCSRWCSSLIVFRSPLCLTNPPSFSSVLGLPKLSISWRLRMGCFPLRGWFKNQTSFIWP